jgi:membrane associated rhomboid family serine protease
MGTIITKIKNKYLDGDIAVQLIYINVIIFLVTALVAVVGKLFMTNADLSFSFLALPASLTTFCHQPWTIITYMFMHAGVWHILFNMLCLYWFGEIFLMFFSSKHLRGIYVLGGIFGGILFMACYNIFPFFAAASPLATIVGASASVLAIIIAAAVREPNYEIYLFLFGKIKLKYMAIAVVVIDLLFITSENAGGHIAHLGGALAGLMFAYALGKGVDITAWINKIIDFICSLFRYKTWHRKPKMKIHYNNTRYESDEDYNARKKQQNDEIDHILDKLKQSGYESLSPDEKKRLFDASNK